jgi:hypothetical protein
VFLKLKSTGVKIMRLDLNNLQYSKESSVGTALRQPLFKLISNIAIADKASPGQSRASRIAKVALDCFVAFLCIIPVGFAWLLGKSICYFSKTKIDPEGLFLAPPPIQIPQELESDRSIDIRVLSKKFNQLQIPNDRSFGQTSKQDCLRLLCNSIASESANIYPDEPEKRKLFCKQLSIYLKGIIKKLESGEVSQEKERDLLMELAESSTRCSPTWLEDAGRLLAELSGQGETVEVKLLRFIQEYKEAIILQFCQKEVDAQWHSLNFVRNILGHELGLNTVLNALDPYAADSDPAFSKKLSRWLFLQRYENVNPLISSIQTNINKQNYDQTYYDFLVNVIKQQNIANPQDYVATHFYNEDYKLTAAGVNLMLRSVGVLK